MFLLVVMGAGQAPNCSNISLMSRNSSNFISCHCLHERSSACTWLQFFTLFLWAAFPNHWETLQNIFLRLIDHQQSAKPNNFCFLSEAVQEPQSPAAVVQKHVASDFSLSIKGLNYVSVSQELFTWPQIMIALVKSKVHQNLFIIISNALHRISPAGQANSYQAWITTQSPRLHCL